MSNVARKEHERKTVENPHGLNSVALAVLAHCSGNASTKKGDCPICHKHALTVNNGSKGRPFIVYCHHCEDHKQAQDYLDCQGFCPTSTRLASEYRSLVAEQARTDKERRAYALHIWNDLRRTNGRVLAYLLKNYFNPRGIKKVPSTSLVTLPPINEGIASHDPGWVLPIRNARTGEFRGIHTVWLSPDMRTKKTPESKDDPVKQTHGLLKGNII